MTADNIERLDERAAELLALQPGWDSYSAKAINAIAVNRALRFCEWLADDAPVPDLVPLNDGGVQLEWHTEGMDEEMEFCPDE